jgi:D-arabinose 1-dehydrogenase-like Zn-dependent alcohol dehydrogenase
MAPTAVEDEGLPTEIAEVEEVEDVEHPEEVAQLTVTAHITCAGTAKSRAISRKSATPGSKRGLHRWT